MNDCVKVFTNVCKEFDIPGISVSSEEQVQFFIKQLRFVNLALSKQFICDWVFRCYKYLEATKKYAENSKHTKAKVSAKQIFSMCTLECHEVLCLLTNSMERQEMV